jgi:hypothetical protein
MSGTPVRDVWLATDHPWARWTKRALFASIGDRTIERAMEGTIYRSEHPPWSGKAPAWLGGARVAVLIDLPGRVAVELALALGSQGYRPVVSINATSAQREAIDMQPVLDTIVAGARFASSFPSGPDVLPAFILDSRREGAGADVSPGRFDNRWKLFTEDLPSGSRLKEERIGSVVILQDATDVLEDVRAVAWAYQLAGIDVRIANVHAQAPAPLLDPPPSGLRRAVAYIRRRFAFRPRMDGSYGDEVPPEPSHG